MLNYEGFWKTIQDAKGLFQYVLYQDIAPLLFFYIWTNSKLLPQSPNLYPVPVPQTHWSLNKMADILPTMFSDTFSWMKIIMFWVKFSWCLFLQVKLSASHHCFRQWLGAKQAPSHFLNQWWPCLWIHIHTTQGTFSETRNSSPYPRYVTTNCFASFHHVMASLSSFL